MVSPSSVRRMRATCWRRSAWALRATKSRRSGSQVRKGAGGRPAGPLKYHGAARDRGMTMRTVRVDRPRLTSEEAREREAVTVEPSRYSAVERLRDGRSVEIRALTPDDRAELLSAVDRTSAESLYRRFFSARRHFTERETAYFVNVDFKGHVALVAVVDEEGRPVIVGGGRYIVVQPDEAELAFAV